MLSIHFTEPRKEVIYNGPASFDIATTEESGEMVTLPTDSDLIRIASVTSVSVSFDVAKVDDLTAAKFVNRLRTYLHDPDLLLL